MGQSKIVYIDDIGELHHSLYCQWLAPPAIQMLSQGFENPTEFRFDTRHNAMLPSDELDLRIGWRKCAGQYTEGKQLRQLMDPNLVVELAAIGIAFLVVGVAVRHRVTEAVQKGKGVDFCLDNGRYVMEVSATRDRRSVGQRWSARAVRTRKYLAQAAPEVNGGYVLVVCLDPADPGGLFSFHSRCEG